MSDSGDGLISSISSRDRVVRTFLLSSKVTVFGVDSAINPVSSLPLLVVTT